MAETPNNCITQYVDGPWLDIHIWMFKYSMKNQPHISLTGPEIGPSSLRAPAVQTTLDHY